MKFNKEELFKPSFNSSLNYQPSLDLENQIKKLDPIQEKIQEISNPKIQIESSTNAPANKEANFIHNLKPLSEQLTKPAKLQISEREKRLKLREAERAKKIQGIQDSNYGVVQSATTQSNQIEEQENIYRNPIGNPIQITMGYPIGNTMNNEIIIQRGNPLIGQAENPIELYSRGNETKIPNKFNQKEKIKEIPLPINQEDSKDLKNIKDPTINKEYVELKENKLEIEKEMKDPKLIPTSVKNQPSNFMNSAFERESQNKIKQQEILKKEYLSMLEKEKTKPPKPRKSPEVPGKVGTGLQIGSTNNEKEKAEKQIKYKNDLDSQLKGKIYYPELNQPDKIHIQNSLEINAEKGKCQNKSSANSNDEFMPMNKETELDKMKKQMQYKMELDKQVNQKNKQIQVIKLHPSLNPQENMNEVHDPNMKFINERIPRSDINSNAAIEKMNLLESEKVNSNMQSKEIEGYNNRENEDILIAKIQKDDYKKELDMQIQFKNQQKNEQIQKEKSSVNSVPIDPGIQTFSRYKKEANPEEDQKKRAQKQFIQTELKRQIEEKEAQKKAQKEKEKLEQLKEDERVQREIQKEKEEYARIQKEKMKDNENASNRPGTETVKIQRKNREQFNENHSTHYLRGQKLDDKPETVTQNNSSQSMNQEIDKTTNSNKAHLFDPLPTSSNAANSNFNINEIKQTASNISQISSEPSNNHIFNQNDHYSNQNDLTGMHSHHQSNNQVISNLNQSKNCVDDETNKKILEIMKILMEKDKKLSDRETVILGQLNKITGTEYMHHLVNQNEPNKPSQNNIKVRNDASTNQSIDIFEESLQSDTHFINMNEFYNFNKHSESNSNKTNINENLDKINKLLVELKQENQKPHNSIEISKELINIKSDFVPCAESKNEKANPFIKLQTNLENSQTNPLQTDETVLLSTNQAIIESKQNKEEFKSEENNSNESPYTEIHNVEDFVLKDENEVKINENFEEKNDLIENNEQKSDKSINSNNQENGAVLKMNSKTAKDENHINEYNNTISKIKENRKEEDNNVMEDDKNNLENEVDIEDDFYRDIELKENNEDEDEEYKNENYVENENENEIEGEIENNILIPEENINIDQNEEIREEIEDNDNEIKEQLIGEEKKVVKAIDDEEEKVEEDNSKFPDSKEKKEKKMTRPKPKIINVFKHPPVKASKKWKKEELKANPEDNSITLKKKEPLNESQLLKDIDKIVSDLQNNLPSADEISAKLRAHHAIKKEKEKERELEKVKERKLEIERKIAKENEIMKAQNKNKKNILNYADENYQEDFENFSGNEEVKEINKEVISESQNFKPRKVVGINVLEKLTSSVASVRPNNSTRYSHFENNDDI